MRIMMSDILVDCAVQWVEAPAEEQGLGGEGTPPAVQLSLNWTAAVRAKALASASHL